MFLLDYPIICKGRSVRVEIFHFQDCHIGKRNCAERAIQKEVREILNRSQIKDRIVRVTMGGDICDVVKPQDIRFDFNEIADWLFEGDADNIRDKLNDIAKAQVERAVHIFEPIKHLIIGNIEANHDKNVRKRYNTDTHREFCNMLGIRELTDEAIIRFRFSRVTTEGKKSGGAVVKMYIRHGYGSGRSAGAEANKIAQMMADGVTQDCDIMFTGHTHTYHPGRIEPVLYVPDSGKIPKQLLTRYRFGANPGCWLLSHLCGRGSYESAACYPSRPMMSVKAVIWPFWNTTLAGQNISRPKIELRQYPIL